MGIGTSIANGFKAFGGGVVALGALPQVALLTSKLGMASAAKGLYALGGWAATNVPLVGSTHAVFGQAMVAKTAVATNVALNAQAIGGVTFTTKILTVTTPGILFGAFEGALAGVIGAGAAGVVAPLLVIGAAVAAIWGISKLCNHIGKSIDRGIEARKFEREAQERQRQHQQEQSRTPEKTQSQEHGGGHSQTDVSAPTQSSRLPAAIDAPYHPADAVQEEENYWRNTTVRNAENRAPQL